MNVQACPECGAMIERNGPLGFDYNADGGFHEHRADAADVVVTALVSALTVLGGNPEYAVEEQQLRRALDVLGYTAVNSAGEPL